MVGQASNGESAPRILIRVSGERVKDTGVGPGFSGSPIFCPTADGTLAKQNKPGPNGKEQPGLLQQASLISDMSLAMVMTSICSLGQVAPNPLMTVLQYFQHELRPAE